MEYHLIVRENERDFIHPHLLLMFPTEDVGLGAREPSPFICSLHSIRLVSFQTTINMDSIRLILLIEYLTIANYILRSCMQHVPTTAKNGMQNGIYCVLNTHREKNHRRSHNSHEWMTTNNNNQVATTKTQCDRERGREKKSIGLNCMYVTQLYTNEWSTFQ